MLTSQRREEVLLGRDVAERMSREGLVTEQMSRVSLHPRSRSTSGSSSSTEPDEMIDNRVVGDNKQNWVVGDGKTNSLEGRTETIKRNPDTLPQEFVVKYLGKKEARGLWGIKHTRKPVDDMVGLARGLQPGTPLPYLQLSVSERGVQVGAHKRNVNPSFEPGLHPIDTISYGVQDLVYTRVFAMIVVKDAPELRGEGGTRRHPFECLAFVCDSRQTARRLTFALANAFQVFSKTIKSTQKKKPTKFAIDLRTPEEIEQDLKNELDTEC